MGPSCPLVNYVWVWLATVKANFMWELAISEPVKVVQYTSVMLLAVYLLTGWTCLGEVVHFHGESLSSLLWFSFYSEVMGFLFTSCRLVFKFGPVKVGRL